MNVGRIVAALGCAVVGAARVNAEGFQLELTGVRCGLSASRLDEHFYQSEAFVRMDSPCRLELGREWRIRSGVDLSTGVLGRDRELGFVGTLGPVFSLGREGFPVELVLGSSATYLSRYEYRGVHFGIPFQFTTHLGFNFHLMRHWTAAYRLQHMSNASISPHNPGLDLHSIALSYHF